MPNLGQNQWFFVQCALEIWWMTLKNNRAPLLWHIKFFVPHARGGALRVKISRGAPLEVQNGTQQDLNTIIDFVNFGGQNDRLHVENGGLQNGTQQDLNKMVDKVKLGGGRQKCRPGAENGGQNRSAYQLTLKEGVPPQPHPPRASFHHHMWIQTELRSADC